MQRNPAGITRWKLGYAYRLTQPTELLGGAAQGVGRTAGGRPDLPGRGGKASGAAGGCETGNCQPVPQTDKHGGGNANNQTCGTASSNVVGFAHGTAQYAVQNVSRVDHAGRHLSDFGVIPGRQGTTAFRDAVRAAAIEVLENPIKTFDHVMTQGGQAVKGFYGKVNGKDVVFFVAKECRGKMELGDLVTAIVPTPQQMINWGLN